jgi:hypothetical protein
MVDLLKIDICLIIAYGEGKKQEKWQALDKDWFPNKRGYTYRALKVR